MVMTHNEKDLSTFQTRVRQMILRLQELKQENQDLYATIDENEQTIEELKTKLTEKERDFEALKMARLVEVSDRDIESAKERVAGMIRNINKCIAVLSDEK